MHQKMQKKALVVGTAMDRRAEYMFPEEYNSERD